MTTVRFPSITPSIKFGEVFNRRNVMSRFDKQLGLCNSYSRAEKLLLIMLKEPSHEKAVSLFLHWYNMCDEPWAHRLLFARRLRVALKHIHLPDLLEPAERQWLASLDDPVSVYRGCEKRRERGLSWTTDIEAARGFAFGKRWVNKQPTLAKALIPKSHIFGVFVSRQESEVALDPRALDGLTSERLGSISVAGTLNPERQKGPCTATVYNA
jgi:hypothetical protein